MGAVMLLKFVKVPSDFECSITQEIMVDPVFTADGETYEREAIADWLKTHDTSPNTNETLEHTQLVPNRKMKSQISEFVTQNKKDLMNELIEAAQRGDVTTARLLLKLDIPANAKDIHGRTALHHVANTNHVEMANLLLQQKSDVDCQDTNGWTALHHAANANSTAVGKLLLEQKCDVDNDKAIVQFSVNPQVQARCDQQLIQLHQEQADLNKQLLQLKAIQQHFEIVDKLRKDLEHYDKIEKKCELNIAEWHKINRHIAYIDEKRAISSYEKLPESSEYKYGDYFKRYMERVEKIKARERIFELSKEHMDECDASFRYWDRLESNRNHNRDYPASAKKTDNEIIAFTLKDCCLESAPPHYAQLRQKLDHKATDLGKEINFSAQWMQDKLRSFISQFITLDIIDLTESKNNGKVSDRIIYMTNPNNTPKWNIPKEWENSLVNTMEEIRLIFQNYYKSVTQPDEKNKLEIKKRLSDIKSQILQIQNNLQFYYAAYMILQCTPLLLAAYRGNTDMIRLLISDGKADILKVDDKGKTVLHWAAQSGQSAAVEFLLIQTIDANAKDVRGNTATDIACTFYQFDCAKIISDHLKKIQQTSSQKTILIEKLESRIAELESQVRRLLAENKPQSSPRRENDNMMLENRVAIDSLTTHSSPSKLAPTLFFHSSNLSTIAPSSSSSGISILSTLAHTK